MRAIRTDKHIRRHGVATAILKRHTKLLRFCNLRRSTHSSQNKLEKIRQAMAMHFDHMYIECLDTKPALSKELEAKHLKELVLLHLDLIQQQAEDLAAKDKIIKELQDENQTLRSRLDRIDRRISLNWQKNSDDTLGDSIKDEYESEACSANNNVPPGSPTVYCLHVSSRLSSSEILTHSQSPVLRSQKQDPLAAAPPSSPSPNCTITRGRDLSPVGRVLRNTSSPVLKSNVVKDEFINCISNNKSFADLISPLRHSPRLDANNTSNSSCIDSVRKDNDSPNYICSRGSNSSKCDPTQASNRGLHETDVPLSNSSPKHVIHNRKSYGKSSVRCSPRDRKTSGSELETSDSESRCRSVTSLASQSEPCFGQLLTVNNSFPCNNKRKLDICEDEPDFKKIKRTTADGEVINKLSIFNSDRILDYDSDGPTNHSLRSRDKTREHNGSSTPSSTRNASTVDSPSNSCHGSPCQSEEEFLDHSNCKRFHSMSDSCSSDNSTKSLVTTEQEEEDSDVTSLEYEQVFVNSAATAAARLREANVKVPGCSLRPVRSAEGVLSTDQPYYLPTEPPAELTEPSDLIGMHDFSAMVPNRQVEIPRWRVCVLSSLYVMEGTENLEDEVFSKRHYKLEQDEKRRKRWDLQRLREQRQYEKLRERYEVRNSTNSSSTNASLGLDGELPPCSNPLCCTPHKTIAVAGSKTNTAGPAGSVCLLGSGSAGGVSGKISSSAATKGGGPAGGGSSVGELVSLWPEPDNALYLEIVDKVPVCAFGQPCAVTPGSEFSLPWLSGARGCEVTVRRRKR